MSKPTGQSRDLAILEKILSLIPHSVFWKDRNSVYIGCNDKFLRDANVKNMEDVIGKTDFDMPWGAENAESYRAYDQHLMSTRTSIVNLEEYQHQADGKVVHVVTSKVPIVENDEVTGIACIYMDITELRKDN